MRSRTVMHSYLPPLDHSSTCRAVYPSAEELQFLTFEPEIFYFLLLPPIIVSDSRAHKALSVFSSELISLRAARLPTSLPHSLF